MVLCTVRVQQAVQVLLKLHVFLGFRCRVSG